MASRRAPSNQMTGVEKDDRTGFPPRASEKAVIAPAVPA